METNPHFKQLSPVFTVHQAKQFQTNSGILYTPDGVVLIDPAFSEAELKAICERFQPKRVLAGFSTHAHYDHLFWWPGFGRDVPTYCSQGTLDYVHTHQQEIIAEFHALQDDLSFIISPYFIEHIPYLAVINSGLQHLNNFSFVVIDIPGHLSGQIGLFFPDEEVLFAADTLSDIEPPSIEGSRRSALEYLASLEKLGKLIEESRWIVPGHGNIANQKEAKRRLNIDRSYLQSLLSLRAESFSSDVEPLARSFLEQLNETRVEAPGSWQIHLQNLLYARQWCMERA